MTRTTWIVLVCALAAMAQVCSALDEDSRYLSKSECQSLQSVRVELKQMVEDAVVIYNGSEPLVNISWAEAIEPPEAATCFTQVRVFYGEERREVVTRLIRDAGDTRALLVPVCQGPAPLHNSIALEFKWKNKVKKGRVTLKETCPEILAEVEASSEDIERAIEDEISDANETDVSQEDSTVLIASTSKKLLVDFYLSIVGILIFMLWCKTLNLIE